MVNVVSSVVVDIFIRATIHPSIDSWNKPSRLYFLLSCFVLFSLLWFIWNFTIVEIMLFTGGSPCVTLPNILSYDLTVSRPIPGVECQRWDSQTPWSHPYTDPAMFPHDATIADASNYCRNPDGGLLPWCYIRYHNVPWVYCLKDILDCGKTPFLLTVMLLTLTANSALGWWPNKRTWTSGHD